MREVRDVPETKALVAPASIAFIASLIDQLDRRGPAKRRTLHVQGSPVTVLAIQVDLPLRKGRRQKPPRPALAEPGNCAVNIVEAEMHQAVTTKDHVGGGQHVTRDVGSEEAAGDLTSLRPKAIRCYQRGHNIHADVIQICNAIRNPAGVAAGRVKQRVYPQSLQQAGQRFPDRGCGGTF